jgi:hypothetical protein
MYILCSRKCMLHAPSWVMPEDEWGGGGRTFPKSGARLGYEHLVLKPLKLGMPTPTLVRLYIMDK